MKNRNEMKLHFAILSLACFVCPAVPTPAGEWLSALPGWQFEFPRDHRSHPDFKTEWWYFTGRLTDERGAVFGYQLTFFRQGVRPPGARTAATSRFVVDDVKLAHFALTDVGGQRFQFGQKLSRGSFGEAGFAADRLAWIEDWSLDFLPDGRFALRAQHGDAALVLKLTRTKPWVVHGENGVSQKAAGAGRASHYYSGTRLAAEGAVTIAGETRAARGESWLDREWGSNQLTPEQAGWDWFSLQLGDGTELMLYQMRTRAGGVDAHSSGTFVARDGAPRHLRHSEYRLTPQKFWTSKATGARYPIAWKLDVPALDLQLGITTPLPAQELVLQPIAYWEGLVYAEGRRGGAALAGHGYMELTGYAGPLVGLSR